MHQRRWPVLAAGAWRSREASAQAVERQRGPLRLSPVVWDCYGEGVIYFSTTLFENEPDILTQRAAHCPRQRGSAERTHYSCTHTFALWGGLSTLPHGIGLHACLHYLGEPVFTTSGACRPQGEGYPRGKVALGRHLIVLASLVLTSCTSSRLELHESSIDPPPTHTQLIALNSQSHLTTSVGAALGVSHLPAIATYQR